MAVFCVRVLQHVFRLIREYFPHFVHRHEAWEGEEREGERERKRDIPPVLMTIRLMVLCILIGMAKRTRRLCQRARF